MPRLTLVIDDTLRAASEARATEESRTLSSHVRALMAEDAGVTDATPMRGRPRDGCSTRSLLRDLRARGYEIERGAYYGSSDDRIDRWYVQPIAADAVDRSGPGHATQRDAALDLLSRI